MGGPLPEPASPPSPSDNGGVLRGAAGSRPPPWPVPSSRLTSPWSLVAVDPAVTPKAAPSLLTQPQGTWKVMYGTNRDVGGPLGWRVAVMPQTGSRQGLWHRVRQAPW